MTILILSVLLLAAVAVGAALVSIAVHESRANHQAWMESRDENDRLLAEYEAMEVDRDYWRDRTPNRVPMTGRCVK